VSYPDSTGSLDFTCQDIIGQAAQTLLGRTSKRGSYTKVAGHASHTNPINHDDYGHLIIPSQGGPSFSRTNHKLVGCSGPFEYSALIMQAKGLTPLSTLSTRLGAEQLRCVGELRLQYRTLSKTAFGSRGGCSQDDYECLVQHQVPLFGSAPIGQHWRPTVRGRKSIWKTFIDGWKKQDGKGRTSNDCRVFGHGVGYTTLLAIRAGMLHENPGQGLQAWCFFPSALDDRQAIANLGFAKKCLFMIGSLKCAGLLST